MKSFPFLLCNLNISLQNDNSRCISPGQSEQFNDASLVFLLVPGPDCSLSVPSTEAFWVLSSVKPSAQSSGRASHQALVHSGLMWVVGGYSFSYSNYHMVLKYVAAKWMLWSFILYNPGVGGLLVLLCSILCS